MPRTHLRMKGVHSNADFFKQLMTMDILMVFKYFSSSSIIVPKAPATIGIAVALTSHNFSACNFKSCYFVIFLVSSHYYYYYYSYYYYYKYYYYYYYYYQHRLIIIIINTFIIKFSHQKRFVLFCFLGLFTSNLLIFLWKRSFSFT